ncbi:MAG: hypothetical protein JSV26_00855 [bacterium]|nr:MAG: hypothetical protein JSV26_00855 [bacterium]
MIPFLIDGDTVESLRDFMGPGRYLPSPRPVLSTGPPGRDAGGRKASVVVDGERRKKVPCFDRTGGDRRGGSAAGVRDTPRRRPVCLPVLLWEKGPAGCGSEGAARPVPGAEGEAP